jgi:hypothetical protein
MEATFTNIYEQCTWGNDGATEYKGTSGGGSEIDYNIQTYVPFLRQFIQSRSIQSVVDVGCGNFKCGPLTYDDLGVSYTGYEVYQKLVDTLSKTYSPRYSFEHLDVFHEKERLASADLCILKDVLQHWSFKSIYTFLDYLVESKKYKYILITNCGGQTHENDSEEDGCSRPLSANFLPLKKYQAKTLYRYHTKEVSVIEIL